MVSFQKTAVVSVEMVSEDHRQDTAACVSLSRSTISKTRTGGFPAPPFSARCRRRRRFSRLGFPCQAVLFEEEPFSSEPLLEETSGAAGAASLERTDPCVNRLFSEVFSPFRSWKLRRQRRPHREVWGFPSGPFLSRSRARRLCGTETRSKWLFPLSSGAARRGPPRFAASAPPVSERGGDVPTGRPRRKR